MKKRHFNAGYSIIEVVAVLVLLIILTGAGIWSVGNVHNTELFGKISHAWPASIPPKWHGGQLIQRMRFCRRRGSDSSCCSPI